MHFEMEKTSERTSSPGLEELVKGFQINVLEILYNHSLILTLPLQNYSLS